MKRRVIIDNENILKESLELVNSMPDMIKTISHNLGIPRTELSKRIGLSRKELYNIERNKVLNLTLIKNLMIIKYYMIAKANPRKKYENAIETIGGKA